MKSVLIVAIISLAMTIGYITNIVKITRCDFKSPYKAEVIRGVGVVVAPVGCILGYVTIKDGNQQ